MITRHQRPHQPFQLNHTSTASCCALRREKRSTRWKHTPPRKTPSVARWASFWRKSLSCAHRAAFSRRRAEGIPRRITFSQVIDFTHPRFHAPAPRHLRTKRFLRQKQADFSTSRAPRSRNHRVPPFGQASSQVFRRTARAGRARWLRIPARSATPAHRVHRPRKRPRIQREPARRKARYSRAQCRRSPRPPTNPTWRK